MSKNKRYSRIPVALSESEFNEFVLPHLIRGARGPDKKLSYFKIFNYILRLMHIGCQWSSIPIDKDEKGKAEIHYTSIFKSFKFWVKKGCFNKIFASTVIRLFKSKILDLSVIHGDGTNTVAKKGATT